MSKQLNDSEIAGYCLVEPDSRSAMNREYEMDYQSDNQAIAGSSNDGPCGEYERRPPTAVTDGHKSLHEVGKKRKDLDEDDNPKLTPLAKYRRVEDLVDAQVTKAEESDANISRIPYDIAVMIFGELSIGPATCLGLTCPRLYSFFRLLHPGPISLRRFVPISNPQGWCTRTHRSDEYCLVCWGNCPWNLGNVLVRWMGPHYRLDMQRGYCLTRTPLRFLKSSVYRELDPKGSARPKDAQETLLFERYDDWKRMSILPEDDAESLPEFAYTVSNVRARPLVVSPFNLGSDWDQHALEFIENDLRYALDFTSHKKFWCGFNIYERKRKEIDQMIDDVLLGFLFEGVRLLGL